jgi:hypothetical protein
MILNESDTKRGKVTVRKLAPPVDIAIPVDPSVRIHEAIAAAIASMKPPQVTAQNDIKYVAPAVPTEYELEVLERDPDRRIKLMRIRAVITE